MNYHSNEWIANKVQEHYNEALLYYPEDKIIGIFYQGSGNYGLDTCNSDVDTKLLVLPTIEDLIFSRKPVGTTHVRKNEEHIDIKDVRSYIQLFRKGNINFVEILFTKYRILNKDYEKEWLLLEAAREAIARMNPHVTVRSMAGHAKAKFASLEHRFSGKADIIDKYGYDNKAFHHLLRIEDFLERYIEGELYERCLYPRHSELLIWEKTNFRPLDEMRLMAEASLNHIKQMEETFCANKPNQENQVMLEFINDVQASIIKKSLKGEL